MVGNSNIGGDSFCRRETWNSKVIYTSLFNGKEGKQILNNSS